MRQWIVLGGSIIALMLVSGCRTRGPIQDSLVLTDFQATVQADVNKLKSVEGASAKGEFKTQSQSLASVYSDHARTLRDQLSAQISAANDDYKHAKSTDERNRIRESRNRIMTLANHQVGRAQAISLLVSAFEKNPTAVSFKDLKDAIISLMQENIKQGFSTEDPAKIPALNAGSTPPISLGPTTAGRDVIVAGRDVVIENTERASRIEKNYRRPVRYMLAKCEEVVAFCESVDQLQRTGEFVRARPETAHVRSQIRELGQWGEALQDGDRMLSELARNFQNVRVFAPYDQPFDGSASSKAKLERDKYWYELLNSLCGLCLSLTDDEITSLNSLKPPSLGYYKLGLSSDSVNPPQGSVDAARLRVVIKHYEPLKVIDPALAAKFASLFEAANVEGAMSAWEEESGVAFVDRRWSVHPLKVVS